MRLLWLHGITWDTPIRDIGWTYVLAVALLVMLGCCLVNLRRAFRGDDDL